MCSLLLIAGCANQKPEPINTVQCPKPAKLSKSVLQIMQPDSTALLQRVDSCLKNSGQLLQSVTEPSKS